jgi:hypothetical protein
MTVSPEQKQAIQDEERYRLEMRTQLQQVRLRRPVMEFLNSPLGIWMLSTIAVGALSLGYTLITEAYKTRQAQTQLARRLITEARSRITQWKTIATSPAAAQRFRESSFDDMMAYLSESPIRNEKVSGNMARVMGVYPEFENRPLGSLYLELNDITRNKHQSRIDAITRVLTNFRDVRTGDDVSWQWQKLDYSELPPDVMQRSCEAVAEWLIQRTNALAEEG